MLSNDQVHAIPADIGKIIKPTPVIDSVVEVGVAPIITIVPIDSKIVFRVLYFFICFLIYGFYLWSK